MDGGDQGVRSGEQTRRAHMARGTTTWNPRGDEPGTNMGREGGEDRGI